MYINTSWDVWYWCLSLPAVWKISNLRLRVCTSTCAVYVCIHLRMYCEGFQACTCVYVRKYVCTYVLWRISGLYMCMCLSMYVRMYCEGFQAFTCVYVHARLYVRMSCKGSPHSHVRTCICMQHACFITKGRIHHEWSMLNLSSSQIHAYARSCARTFCTSKNVSAHQIQKCVNTSFRNAWAQTSEMREHRLHASQIINITDCLHVKRRTTSKYRTSHWSWDINITHFPYRSH